jgi:phosphoribosylanthranilate isomerase
MSVRIKICGVTRAEDAALAVELGADMIGLNFYPPSPRSLTLKHACAIRDAVCARAELVGVFVNAARDYIEECRRELCLDYLQFHGDEEDSALSGWPVPVIRALRLKETPAPAQIAACKADYVLLDTHHPRLFGGTGQTRSLDGLEQIDLARVVLSGGLSPGNVAEAAALRPWAVDVASGVECAPGVKDPAKLRSFIANAKSSR